MVNSDASVRTELPVGRFKQKEGGDTFIGFRNWWGLHARCSGAALEPGIDAPARGDG